jgi:hypothetical protein
MWSTAVVRESATYGSPRDITDLPLSDISLVINIYFLFCRTNSVRDLIFCLILYMVNYARVGKCIMRKSKRYDPSRARTPTPLSAPSSAGSGATSSSDASATARSGEGRGGEVLLPRGRSQGSRAMGKMRVANLEGERMHVSGTKPPKMPPQSCVTWRWRSGFGMAHSSGASWSPVHAV